MAEKTLVDLLAELDTLDVVAGARRLHEIVAEVANHIAEVPGGLDGLARSLVPTRRAAAAYVIRRLRLSADLLARLLGDAHPSVRGHAIRAAGDWPLPELVPPLFAGLDAPEADVATAALASLAKIFDKLGADAADAAMDAVPEAAWRPLLARLSDKGEPERKVKAVVERRAKRVADAAELEEFGRVVRTGDVEPAHEREALLDDLVARVQKPGGRSFILVGDAGVGKTHLLHALAGRLAALDPPWLTLETSTAEVMVGTKYIGEWETRLGELIQKCRAPRRVLLSVTNVPELVGAGTTSKNDAGFMSMLGPYLRRGDLVIAGEATAHAVQRGLERAGQKGAFQLVHVGEPDAAAVARIVARRVEAVARRAGVAIVVPPEVQELIVGLAATYFTGLAEPGRSLRLLAEVLAPRLEEARGEPIELRADDVVAGLSRVSGLPEGLLNDRRPLDPAAVRAFFEERVLGQREAVDAMVDLITLVKAGLNDPGKPLGVLFFVGPTGVGKTEIARALAEFIYGSPERMLRLDLSEYKDYDSYEKLIGGRAAREGATLAGRVREKPFSVILLDEIEKAHPNVFDLFLQVFDDGRLTDAHGERADFRQTLVVMTSNLGSAFEPGGLGFGAGGSEPPGEERVLKEVRRFFRPEFVNRLGRIVVFKPLSGDIMRTLVRREVGKVLLRSGILRRGLRVDVDDAVIDLLLEQGFSPEYGARPLKRRVEQLLLTPLARAIVALGPDDRGALLAVAADEGRVAVRRRGARPAARQPDERLRLKRPEDERLLSVKPGELPGLIAALDARVTALAERGASDRLAERKSEIVAATASPSFWDDPPRARRQLAEMVHLEELVEGLARLRRRVDGLVDLARNVQRHPNLKTRFQEAHADFVDDLVELEHRFFGEKPEDRRDAFLALRKIGAGREAEEAVELLRGTYVSWAERRGLALTWLRDGAEPLVLVEGRAAFGLLRGEGVSTASRSAARATSTRPRTRAYG
jgi:ATP-dependent Clp protease ATP-binding subunit ClpC